MPESDKDEEIRMLKQELFLLREEISGAREMLEGAAKTVSGAQRAYMAVSQRCDLLEMRMTRAEKGFRP